MEGGTPQPKHGCARLQSRQLDGKDSSRPYVALPAMKQVVIGNKTTLIDARAPDE